MVCEFREDKTSMFKVITSVCTRASVRRRGLSAFIHMKVIVSECVGFIVLQICLLSSAP